MRRLSLFSMHAVSLLIMTVFAAINWSSFEVTAELGDSSIGVTGFAAFPAIGALLTLQVVTLVLSIMMVGWVSRVLSAILVPLMSWLVFTVVLTKDQAIQGELSRIVLESTGVSGSLGQQDFIQASQGNMFWVLFSIAVVLNILILVFRAMVPAKTETTKNAPRKKPMPDDLWGSQR
jgi:hypothetical protein